MAKKGGAPENLDPVRTKEEAKKRGRNGGIKSGEARRNKRDAKNAMNLLLNMAAKGQLKDNLASGNDHCNSFPLIQTLADKVHTKLSFACSCHCPDEHITCLHFFWNTL